MYLLFNREMLNKDKVKKNNLKNKKRAHRRKKYREYLKKNDTKKMTCKGVSFNGRVVTAKSIDDDTKKVLTYSCSKKKGNTFLNELPSPRNTGMTTVIVSTTSMATSHIQWIKHLDGKIIDINVNFLSMVARAAPSKRSRTKWSSIGISRNIKNYIHHKGQWYDYCNNEGYQIEYETAFKEQVLVGLGFKGFEYKASYLLSMKEDIQEPHIDYEWGPLKSNKGKLYVFFFPLTHEGMQLQIWDYWNLKGSQEGRFGEKVFIPYGVGVLLPGHIVHAGGFMSGVQGNVRAHIYIGFDNAILPVKEYTNYNEGSDGNKSGPDFSEWCISENCSLKQKAEPKEKNENHKSKK